MQMLLRRALECWFFDNIAEKAGSLGTEPTTSQWAHLPPTAYSSLLTCWDQGATLKIATELGVGLEIHIFPQGALFDPQGEIGRGKNSALSRQPVEYLLAPP
mgnify:CR=1 FL=1